MKSDKVREHLKIMIEEMDKTPLDSRGDEFYKRFRTLKSAETIIRNREISRCENCGEEMVCPKCTPVIEQTNSLIIRHKDTDYNGGWPNVLVITPMIASGDRCYSTATIAGDNFFTPGNKTAGHTYIERGTVEQVAHTLANTSIETWCRLFGFPKNRLLMARDIQLLLRKHLGLEVI